MNLNFKVCVDFFLKHKLYKKLYKNTLKVVKSKFIHHFFQIINFNDIFFFYLLNLKIH